MDLNSLTEKSRQELQRAFRPEFLNRLDEIVLFKPLTMGEIEEIVESLGGGQISDPVTLRPIVEAVLVEHPAIVEDIRKGKDKAKNVLFGKVMGKTRGRGNPEVVRGLIEEILDAGE